MQNELRFPSVEGLRAFEATARLGSFERAAEELHVTASALSKRIGVLESLIGTPLLQRQAKPLALTPTGKEYLAQVVEALALLAAMPQHRRSTQRRERLVVSAPPTFARLILVPALPGFEQQAPELEIELAVSSPFLDSPTPPADLEIRMGVADEALWLMQDRVTPMAAPSLLQRHPIKQPADLAGLPLLRSPIEPWQPWFRAAGLDWPEPQQGTRFVDLGLTLEAALCGQGVVLARPSLAGPLLERGQLRRLFELSAPAARHYGLLRHADTASARRFEDWLRAHCARPPQEKSSGKP
ncbi:LysR family transcriptional regulator [Pelomonas sp. SE-A7]|uniref:LysR family transcriptional regulator n=1 Tax=Pelomonas sp. SE-A7 TaxID=3054953 RepID=UPI00259CDEBC|nr:LysR family transcriptional regulator [Pelomonas sp. SE-A7]MDM4765207.1 LysR substrate-binding domain-containing protein [Pelomonas sp. SE-A7]